MNKRQRKKARQKALLRACVNLLQDKAPMLLGIADSICVRLVRADDTTAPGSHSCATRGKLDRLRQGAGAAFPSTG